MAVVTLGSNYNDRVGSRSSLLLGGSPIVIGGTTTVTDVVGLRAVASLIEDYANPIDTPIKSVSSTYGVVAGDAGYVLECSGTFTITFPDDLDTGFQCVVVNVGTGVITLAAETTLQSMNSYTKLVNQYGAVSVYHRGSNVWIAFGDLSS